MSYFPEAILPAVIRFIKPCRIVVISLMESHDGVPGIMCRYQYSEKQPRSRMDQGYFFGDGQTRCLVP